MTFKDFLIWKLEHPCLFIDYPFIIFLATIGFLFGGQNERKNR